ncbi:MAG: cytochrome b5 domain-containing protein [Candidatus Woesearchaeota archaeon]
MKIYSIVAILFVLVFVIGCTESTPVVNTPVQNEPVQNNNEQTNTQGTDEPVNNQGVEATDNTTPPEPEPSGISLSELSAHNERTDCWIGYKGKVYDITDFVPVHPGGASKITPYCGTASEFEKAFTNQHGTSQVSKLMREGLYMGDLQ